MASPTSGQDLLNSLPPEIFTMVIPLKDIDAKDLVKLRLVNKRMKQVLDNDEKFLVQRAIQQSSMRMYCMIALQGEPTFKSYFRLRRDTANWVQARMKYSITTRAGGFQRYDSEWLRNKLNLGGPTFICLLNGGFLVSRVMAQAASKQARLDLVQKLSTDLLILLELFWEQLELVLKDVIFTEIFPAAESEGSERLRVMGLEQDESEFITSLACFHDFEVVFDRYLTSKNCGPQVMRHNLSVDYHNEEQALRWKQRLGGKYSVSEEEIEDLMKPYWYEHGKFMIKSDVSKISIIGQVRQEIYLTWSEPLRMNPNEPEGDLGDDHRDTTDHKIRKVLALSGLLKTAREGETALLKRIMESLANPTRPKDVWDRWCPGYSPPQSFEEAASE